MTPPQLTRDGKSSLLLLLLLQSILQIVLDCNLLLLVRRNEVKIDIEKEIMMFMVIINR
ncbi:MAG: hypothetical protein L0H53_13810 [Candidatus Nitrosocosmicus sp.]|nr:hypothetical protein [Candidatus Nitrosocosmicus sp.]